MENRREPAATIFIAEDNPILLQGLDRALCANGYATRTAEHGAAVLELLSKSPAPPDLLLLDVMMPGMSGFDVLRALQAEPRWADLPVVLITATTDESLPITAMQFGAVDVLLKPFRLGELLSRIDSHVRRHRGADPSGAPGPGMPTA